MPDRVNCPWCEAFNKVDGDGWPWCHGCKHRADRPREQCDCLMCWQLPEVPMEVPDLLLLPQPAEIELIPDAEPFDLTEPGAVQVVTSFKHPTRWDAQMTGSAMVIQIREEVPDGQWVELKVSAGALEELLRLVNRAAEFEALKEAAREQREARE